VESRSTFDLGPAAGWALTLLLAVFAVAPLTYPGFFEAESGFVPTFRAAGLDPAWFGPGDPVRGEGAFPYLLARPFFQLWGSGVAAIKWGYGLSFLLGAWGIYAWLRRWLGGGGAVLGAVVYTYLPWHLATVYSRAATGEAWLWAAWPWLLWAIDRLAAERRAGVLAAAVVGLPSLGVALMSQPGLAVLSLPFLAAYGLVALPAPGRETRPSRGLRRAAGTGLILAAVVLLFPVARSAPPPRVDFEEHFLAPFQLLASGQEPAGAGRALAGMGLAAAGLSLLAGGLWLGQRRAGGEEAHAGDPRLARPLGFWAGVLLLLLLLTLPVAALLWRLTGLQGLLTMPWQVLALAGLPLAFLAGSVVRLDEDLARLPAWAGLLALVVLASYGSLDLTFTQVDPGREPVAAFRGQDAPRAQVLLLDTEIEPPAEISPTLVLTVTWQAVEPVAVDYTTFVHLLDADGDRVTQRDSQPCSGECPTSTWQPGAIVVDRYELALGAESPPGPYTLALGLYLLESGERAAVVGREDDRIVIDVPH
jgi:hypothetical protein